MTIEEAIAQLELTKKAFICNYADEYISEALDMAIRSLEAWEKVREIFKAKATSEDWEYIHDLQIWEDALEIIDKYLSEVEHDN